MPNLSADTISDRLERLETLERQTVHALKVHQVWRETVRALRTGGRSSQPEPEDACAIHTWLTLGMHPAFRRLPLYGQTLAAHARFHQAIAALHADPSSSQRETTAAAMALKDCLEEWLTVSRRRQ